MGEFALRRHDLQQVTRLKDLVRKAAKSPIRNFFDGHPTILFGGSGTDGVGSADLLSVQLGAQGEVLAGCELKFSLQVSRNIQGYGNTIGGFLANFANGERVEFHFSKINTKSVPRWQDTLLLFGEQQHVSGAYRVLTWRIKPLFKLAALFLWIFPRFAKRSIILTTLGKKVFASAASEISRKFLIAVRADFL